MNTDVILDFVVDNYLWFIIGGVVILLAILGFVADKKKIIPNRSKTKKLDGNETLKNEPPVSESSISSEPEILEPNVETLNYDVKNNFEEINPVETKLDVLEPIEMVEPENEIVEEQFAVASEEKMLADESQNVNIFNAQPDFVQKKEDYNSAIEKIAETNVNEIEPKYNNFGTMQNENQEVSNLKVDDIAVMVDNSNELNNISNLTESNEPLVDANKEEAKENNQIPSLSFSTVDDDINRINNMNFSDEDNFFKSEKDPDEKLEDTMQISYSQLKEIVQDIIAENEAENNNEKTVENIINTEDIKPELKPSEEKIETQNLSNENGMISQEIKQQDNEDDVWKF